MAAADIQFVPKSQPVPWKDVLSVDVDALQKNGATVSTIESLYHKLAGVVVGEDDTTADDVENVMTLWEVSQLVMEGAHALFQDASAAAAKARGEVEKQKEAFNTLMTELEQTEAELQMAETSRDEALERLAAGGGTSEEAAAHKAEMEDLKERFTRLTRELQDARDAVGVERTNSAKLQASLESERARVAALERDVAAERATAAEMAQAAVHKERKEAARRAEEARKAGEAGNEKAKKYVAEISALSSKVAELEEQVVELATELESATDAYEQAMSDAEESRSALMESDRVIADTEDENATLRASLADAQSALLALKEEADAVMEGFHREMDEAATALDKRDAQLMAARAEIESLKSAVNRDSGTDPTEVAQLRGLLAEKEEELSQAQEALSEALGAVESGEGGSAITPKTGGGKGKAMSQSASSKWRALVGWLPKTGPEQASSDQQKSVMGDNEALAAALRQKTAAEETLAAKEAQVVQLKLRMHEYESGQYGLSEAVADRDETLAKLELRNVDIERLVKDLNDRAKEVEDLFYENQVLREKAGVSKDAVIAAGDVQLKGAMELESLRALNATLQEEISLLEKERLEMKSAARLSALGKSSDAMRLGLSVSAVKALEDYAEALKTAEARGGTLPSRPDVPVSGSSAVDAVKEAARAKAEVASLQQELADARAEAKFARLSEKSVSSGAVAQNEELRLLLQQVLGALKEWEGPGSPIPADLSGLAANVDAVLSSPLVSPEAVSAAGQRERDLEDRLAKQRREVKKLRASLREARAQMESLKSRPPIAAPGTPAVNGPRSDAATDTGKGFNSDVVAKLVQELLEKETEGEVLESRLASARLRMEEMVEQQKLLYRDHQRALERVGAEVTASEKRVQGLEEELARARVVEAEASRLAELVNASGSEATKIAGEAVHSAAVLRGNLAVLTRRYAIVSESEKAAQRSLARAEGAAIEAEAVVQERLAAAAEENAALHDRLNALVKSSMDSVSRRVHLGLVARHEVLVGQVGVVQAREAELVLAASAQRAVRAAATAAEARVAELEVALTEMRARLESSTSPKPVDEMTVVVAAANRKAEVAEERLSGALSVQADLEKRLEAADGQLMALTSANHRLAEELSAAIEKAAGAVPASALARVEEQLKQAEEKLVSAESVARRARRATDGALKRADGANEALKAARVELSDMRQALEDAGSVQGDGAAMIAVLWTRLLAAQVAGADAIRDAHGARADARRASSSAARAEAVAVERGTAAWRVQEGARRRVSEAEAAARFARTKGLDEAARASASARAALKRVDARLAEAEAELAETRLTRWGLEDDVKTARAELEIVQAAASSSVAFAAGDRVSELRDRLVASEVASIAAKRAATVAESKCKTAEAARMEAEKRLVEADEATVRARLAAMDEVEAAHGRVAEVEALATELKQEREALIAVNAAKEAGKIQSRQGGPDGGDYGRGAELSAAIRQLDSDQRMIVEYVDEIAGLKERLATLSGELAGAQEAVARKDQEVVEARLAKEKAIAERVAAESELSHVLNNKENTNGSGASEGLKGSSRADALAGAVDAIEGLKAQLAAKEQAVQRFQDLLRAARATSAQEKAEDQARIERLQSALQAEADKTISGLKAAAEGRRPIAGGPGKGSSSVASESLATLLEERNEANVALRTEVERLSGIVKDVGAALDVARAEAAAARDAVEAEGGNAAARALVAAVEELKTRLGAREAEVGALKKAVMELRAELASALAGGPQGGPSTRTAGQDLGDADSMEVNKADDFALNEALKAVAAAEVRAAKAERDLAESRKKEAAAVKAAKVARVAAKRQAGAPSPAPAPAPNSASTRAEVPGSAAASEKKADSGAFVRWEAEKRYQRRIEVLRGKVSEKTKAVAEAEKRATAAETSAAGVRKERDVLLKKLSKVERIASPGSLVAVEELQRRLDEAERRTSAAEREAEVVLETRVRVAEAAARVAEESRVEIEENSLRERMVEAQSAAFQADITNLELRFDKEAASTELSRVRAMLEDLQAAVGGRKNRGELTGESGGGAGRVAELEATVQSLERVVKTVRAENETLRNSGVSNVEYMKAVEAGKEAKRAAAAAEARLANAVDKARAELGAEWRAELDKAKSTAAKESEGARRARKAVAMLTSAKEDLERAVETLRSRLRASEAELEEERKSVDELMTEMRKAEDRVKELEEELSGLDPEFFEELEDLKYSNAKMAELVEKYEGQAVELEARFGLDAGSLVLEK